MLTRPALLEAEVEAETCKCEAEAGPKDPHWPRGLNIPGNI